MNRVDHSLLLLATQDVLVVCADLGVIPVLVGGLAVAKLAFARPTKDVDVMILYDSANAETVISSLLRHGFRARFENLQEFAKQNHMVTVEHVATGSYVNISLGSTLFEQEILERSQMFISDALTIRIISAEDLVILKSIAFQPKDLEDIRNIVSYHPTLNRLRIQHWVEAYAKQLDLPDRWREIAKLL